MTDRELKLGRRAMTPLNLAYGMAKEIKAAIYLYHESMPLATVIGVLEIVKIELMQEHADKDNEDE